MEPVLYNDSVILTALSPQAGRQFLDAEKKKRATVFIDGSNWYHKLRLLLTMKPPIDFDLRSFTQHLVAPDILGDLRYYIGRVKRQKNDPKSEALYNNQQRLIGFLQQQDIGIGFGHIIPYPDGSYHEKGVDVLIAVDMMKGAIERTYETAYLISSDTDLVPAVNECRKLGREMIYVGSSIHGQSIGLTQCCDRTILLKPTNVLPFMPTNDRE